MADEPWRREVLEAHGIVAEPAAPGWQERFEFPDPPADQAFYGLAGDVVRTFGPHTEGSPVAILGQFLAAFGNAAGARPYFQVGGTRHHVNLFPAIVGATGAGQKGSGLSVALLPVEFADGGWSSEARCYGLATGQGIVHRLRDPVVNGKGEVVDAGARDKRLLAIETEFAKVLRQAGQPESILSMILRQAWDGQTLQTMTKFKAEQASGAHLSLIAHTTPADLRRHLDDTEVLNGFANRFIWLASRRERMLPSGGDITVEMRSTMGARTARALERASGVGRMQRGLDATRLWEDVYPSLSGARPGAFGAIVGRAAAQVLRLGMAYALTDGSRLIREPHLRAALALWDYAERSALWVFGASTGNRDADLLLEELRVAYPEGLTRTQLRDLLGRNRRVAEPLGVLAEQRLAAAHRPTDRPAHRPVETWTANPDPPPVTSVTSVHIANRALDEAGKASGATTETTEEEHLYDENDISTYPVLRARIDTRTEVTEVAEEDPWWTDE